MLACGIKYQRNYLLEYLQLRRRSLSELQYQSLSGAEGLRRLAKEDISISGNFTQDIFVIGVYPAVRQGEQIDYLRFCLVERPERFP